MKDSDIAALIFNNIEKADDSIIHRKVYNLTKSA